jgi:hypothetical protein
VTREQLAVIHLAKKQLGWSEELYRAILRELGGVAGDKPSAKDLTAEGFDLVMAYATSWGFNSTWRQRTFGKRPGMATPGQVELIRTMWREYTGGDDDPALNKWLDNKFGCSALRFAGPKIAHSAITALRAMKSRKAAKAS